MKALITGISGFAGSHLAELLIEKGYKVFGTFFDKSTFSNLNGFVNKIKVYRCDIRNYEKICFYGYFHNGIDSVFIFSSFCSKY